MMHTIGLEALSDLKPGQFGFIVDVTCNETCKFLFEAGCFPGDFVTVETVDAGLIFARVERKAVYIPMKTAHHIITHPINLVVCLN